MKKKLCISLIVLFLVVFAVFLLGRLRPEEGMKDGFYTAEMSDYSHGWKEYLCIMVKNNTIVYAEFNAKDESGYIKAWDNAYMRNMITNGSTYPNEYTRSYVAQLISTQNPYAVDAVSGATNSGSNFAKLSAAVVERAREGDSSTIVVN